MLKQWKRKKKRRLLVGDTERLRFGEKWNEWKNKGINLLKSI